ncbi:ATP-dependent zinc metalloprotease FtsH [Variovorax sp. V512]
MLVIAMVLFTVFKQFDTRGGVGSGTVSYSEFLDQVRNNQIKSAIIPEGAGGGEIVAVTNDDRKIRTTATVLDRGLVGDLIDHNVKFDVKPREEGSLLMTLLVSWGPMLLLIGVWIYFMRQMQGGGKGGAFSFGKSKARMMDENNNTVTFADVAGCDEAKEEVREVVDFLKDPQRFQKLGGRIPRGLLLVGPPGTGKTLLAKSIAGEAKVPFFSISGSDFVEMFVGVGAARVRDMFENAKKNAPCIIFIDEIDAVGRQRGAGLGGGNDEREQTLNQMLVEMDGFETNLGVIVVAATNRPDILDAALLRPGRFDRQVYVTLPDIRGREQILAVHMRKVPLGQDVNPSVIARGTPGMSGADLANLCNEAALMAARRNARVVEMQDFEKAKDKIFMGPERKSMVMPEEERRNTAYHESGHALIGKLLPKCDPVHKVTIIPRGRALGVTMSLPSQDRYSYDREYMLNQISMLFGGRIAEEVFMHQMTTGASNDFERATSIARDMVTRYGMTRRAGPDGLCRERRRSVPGPLGHQDHEHERTDHGKGRRRGAPHHRRAVRPGARASSKRTATRCTPWPRRCSNGKPSTANSSTTSWPAAHRARPRTGRRAFRLRAAAAVVARRPSILTRRRPPLEVGLKSSNNGAPGPVFHGEPDGAVWQTSRFRIDLAQPRA